MSSTLFGSASLAGYAVAGDNFFMPLCARQVVKWPWDDNSRGTRTEGEEEEEMVLDAVSPVCEKKCAGEAEEE